jgi:hypothetical protein
MEMDMKEKKKHVMDRRISFKNVVVVVFFFFSGRRMKVLPFILSLVSSRLTSRPRQFRLCPGEEYESGMSSSGWWYGGNMVVGGG